MVKEIMKADVLVKDFEHAPATIIQASELSYKYPSNEHFSVQNLSLAIKAGQCTGIIGPNGAGKSTTISLLCALLTPSEGVVEYYPGINSPDINSSDIYSSDSNSPGNQPKQLSLKENIEQKVALIPQEYAFYPELTVKQNLEYFISLSETNRTTRKALLQQSLTQCQLNHVATQKAAGLSGGYKRRLNIAIALSKSPEIIFLDEPTVGIDPVSRQNIIDLLEELKRQGKTLIYTSHMLNEVEQLCDEVILLEQGKAIAVSQTCNDNMLVTLEFFPGQQNTSLLNALGLPNEVEQTNFSLNIKDVSHLQQVFSHLSEGVAGLKNVHFSQNSIDQLYFNAYKAG